jgi:hypothetical protein
LAFLTCNAVLMIFLSNFYHEVKYVDGWLHLQIGFKYFCSFLSSNCCYITKNETNLYGCHCNFSQSWELRCLISINGKARKPLWLGDWLHRQHSVGVTQTGLMADGLHLNPFRLVKKKKKTFWKSADDFKENCAQGNIAERSVDLFFYGWHIQYWSFAENQTVSACVFEGSPGLVLFQKKQVKKTIS